MPIKKRNVSIMLHHFWKIRHEFLKHTCTPELSVTATQNRHQTWTLWWLLRVINRAAETIPVWTTVKTIFNVLFDETNNETMGSEQCVIALQSRPVGDTNGLFHLYVKNFPLLVNLSVLYAARRCQVTWLMSMDIQMFQTDQSKHQFGNLKDVCFLVKNMLN